MTLMTELTELAALEELDCGGGETVASVVLEGFSGADGSEVGSAGDS